MNDTEKIEPKCTFNIQASASAVFVVNELPFAAGGCVKYDCSLQPRISRTRMVRALSAIKGSEIDLSEDKKNRLQKHIAHFRVT
jgi:hypothetical protein